MEHANRAILPQIIAAVLALGGLFWAVLLAGAGAEGGASAFFISSAYFAPGYLVWFGWIARAFRKMTVRYCMWFWLFSMACNGFWLVRILADRGRPAPLPTTWWAIATGFSAIAMLFDRNAKSALTRASANASDPHSALSRKSLERQKVFDKIHRKRAWGDGESASGLGSTQERAASFLPALIDLVRSLGISTLLDAPSGDFNWAEPLADSVSFYIGIDVVPALVASCAQRFTSPRRSFLCLDFVEQTLPQADLVFCRDGLVHLSDRDIIRALNNLRTTGAEYFIATTFIGTRDHRDIRTGDWRPLNMQHPPFSLPEPLRLIDEQCHHTGGIYADKRLGLWRFRDLPKFVT